MCPWITQPHSDEAGARSQGVANDLTPSPRGTLHRFLGLNIDSWVPHPHHVKHMLYPKVNPRGKQNQKEVVKKSSTPCLLQVLPFLHTKLENSRMKLKVTSQRNNSAKPNSHVSFQQGRNHGLLEGHVQVGKRLWTTKAW